MSEKYVPKGTEISIRGRNVIVGPSCGENGGAWYCVTHKQNFVSNFAADLHTGHGKHEMTFVCNVHGPEEV